ncbi:MAG: aromatic-ring-hydroxylating dioxygenase subunit beta [Alphaproteobacteria bacterium]
MALAETKTVAAAASRSEVEDFLYEEAALLDAWELDAWLEILCDDARYLVPPNEAPDGDPDDTLFIIADDIHRIRSRVKRLKSPDAHAEYPPSRTRRLITNVRILESSDTELTATSNFSVHRFRRGGKGGVYVGRYIHRLVRDGSGFKIAERRVILDAEELGALGAVSFIL